MNPYWQLHGLADGCSVHWCMHVWYFCRITMWQCQSRGRMLYSHVKAIVLVLLSIARMISWNSPLIFSNHWWDFINNNIKLFELCCSYLPFILYVNNYSSISIVSKSLRQMENTILHVLHCLASANRTNLLYFLVFPIKITQGRWTSSPTSTVDPTSYTRAACMPHFIESSLTDTDKLNRMICTSQLDWYAISCSCWFLFKECLQLQQYLSS